MTTAQQLREALGKTTEGEWKVWAEHQMRVRPAVGLSRATGELFYSGTGTFDDVRFIVLAHNLLPTLLDEYEKLEREAEAGRALAEEVLGWEAEAISMGWNGEDDMMALNVLRMYVTKYHTACGKEEDV